MSAKSILGNDFQFNRIRFNTQEQGKYFEKSIQLNALDELNFHDGTQLWQGYTSKSYALQDHLANAEDMPNKFTA